MDTILENTVTFKLSLPYTEEEIDLSDYGHEGSWSDLSEQEKNEIKDVIREAIIVDIQVITD